jgi:hypothetical protein
MFRREFFFWLLQLIPKVPKPPTNMQAQNAPIFTCPLGHASAAEESAFSSKTLVCAQCGVYFHILPLS